MALNFEAAQLVVGAALLDRRFARELLHDRAHALQAVAALPIAPQGIRLTEDDRQALGAIRAETVQDFARVVSRLCGPIRPVPPPADTAAAADDASAALAFAAGR